MIAFESGLDKVLESFQDDMANILMDRIIFTCVNGVHRIREFTERKHGTDGISIRHRNVNFTLDLC